MTLEQPTLEAIRAARQAAGHTQQQAGAMVHAQRRTWQDWETGRRTMPMMAWELYLLKTGQIYL